MPSITSFTALAQGDVAASVDVLPIVDISAGVSGTKKITVANLVNAVLAAPGAIGGTTPAAGAFTTLSASGNATLSGTLGVTGAATLSSTLSAQGTTVTTLQASGAATFQSTVGITGALSGSTAVFTAGQASIATTSTTGSTRTVVMGSDAFTNAFIGTTTAHDLSILRGGSIVAVAGSAGITIPGTLSVAGQVNLGGALGAEGLRVIPVASSVNRLEISGSATGNAVSFAANGSDANIDMALITNGTGVLRFGVHSALAAETVTGYITIKDAAGNTRKLAVVS